MTLSRATESFKERHGAAGASRSEMGGHSQRRGRAPRRRGIAAASVAATLRRVGRRDGERGGVAAGSAAAGSAAPALLCELDSRSDSFACFHDGCSSIYKTSAYSILIHKNVIILTIRFSDMAT